MPQQLKITPHEHVTVVTERADLLAVDVVWHPSDDRPPLHLHPRQDEHFEVRSGTLHTEVDGVARVLGPGDTLDIPRGAAHRMWAPDGEVRARWETTPAGRTAQWFRTLDHLQREGRVGGNGMPGPLAFAALLTEFDDVFVLATSPAWLVKGALTALAPIGRMKGYRPLAA